mmetsp:Transcript_73853/g.210695  ORF Transcript_73853/g.210695 Transcript_73853/m.210695 type:complete len:252 (-) Transcript_73853:99-854(-)
MAYGGGRERFEPCIRYATTTREAQTAQLAVAEGGEQLGAEALMVDQAVQHLLDHFRRQARWDLLHEWQCDAELSNAHRMQSNWGLRYVVEVEVRAGLRLSVRVRVRVRVRDGVRGGVIDFGGHRRPSIPRPETTSRTRALQRGICTIGEGPSPPSCSWSSSYLGGIRRGGLKRGGIGTSGTRGEIWDLNEVPAAWAHGIEMAGDLNPHPQPPTPGARTSTWASSAGAVASPRRLRSGPSSLARSLNKPRPW